MSTAFSCSFPDEVGGHRERQWHLDVALQTRHRAVLYVIKLVMQLPEMNWGDLARIIKFSM